MMNRKSIWLWFVAVLVTNVLWAQNVKIDVTLLNNKFTEAKLQNAADKNQPQLAVATITDNHFLMQTTLKEDGIFALSFDENNSFILCLHPNDNIKLTLDASNLRIVPSVSGSESILFTKKMTDKLMSRQHYLDSLNLALQKNSTQIMLSSVGNTFGKFTQSANNANADVLSALQNNDSLVALGRWVNSGVVDKKHLDEYMVSSVKFLKLMRNYYATYQNHIENIAPNYQLNQWNNLPGYEEFFAEIAMYNQTLDEHNAIVQSVFENYIKDADAIVNRYDELFFDGGLDKPKAKQTFCNRIAALVAQYGYNAAEKSKDISGTTEILKGLGSKIDKSAMEHVQKLVSTYQQQFNNYNAELSSACRQLMLDYKSDLSALMFLDNFSTDKGLQQEVVLALHEKYPQNAIVEERYNKINTPQFRTAEGSIAPELEFADPDGKVRRLSDLRGKVVLVDFWASWCGPCRKENPHVVSMYAKYHDKGFEVFSVSLDNKAESWKAAIAKDQLVWPNHVSDLKGWGSAAAKLYGVSSIPSTFLLDREGHIIAKGLRGEALTAALKQIFGE